ncbi:hypothetical protein A3Q56_05396 [Intoshia linei]|uniref:Uncharacterized protein n=1 Tax=Intoshia linei TaxID=1819745 RepID=A0A177AZT7_9BILA|nr:hypothetical protein A3Q56_05396 [Intoshia linei]
MISQDKIELVFVDVDNIINGSILSNSISYSEGKKTYNKKYTVLGDKTEEISINSVQELNLDDTQNIIV